MMFVRFLRNLRPPRTGAAKQVEENAKSFRQAVKSSGEATTAFKTEERASATTGLAPFGILFKTLVNLPVMNGRCGGATPTEGSGATEDDTEPTDEDDAEPLDDEEEEEEGTK